MTIAVEVPTRRPMSKIAIELACILDGMSCAHSGWIDGGDARLTIRTFKGDE